MRRNACLYWKDGLSRRTIGDRCLSLLVALLGWLCVHLEQLHIADTHQLERLRIVVLPSGEIDEPSGTFHTDAVVVIDLNGVM